MSFVSGCVLIWDGDLRLRGMMTHGLAMNGVCFLWSRESMKDGD